MYPDTPQQTGSESPKRRLLIRIIIGTVAAIVVAIAGFFIVTAVMRMNDDGAVKNELITQNTRLRLGSEGGVLSAEAIHQVASTDRAEVTLKVAPDQKTYCIEAISRKYGDTIRYHFEETTPELEPAQGACGENADKKPGVPEAFTVGAAEATALSFTWSTVPNARIYTLECSTTAAFSAPKVVTAGASGGKIEGLTPGVAYYCRVNAENNVGKSDYSSVLTMTTTVLLAVPESLKITTVSSSSLSYAWSATEGASYYVLEYATDPNFTESVQRLTVTNTTGTLTGLKPGTGYFFHVKVVTNAANEQQAPYSEIVQGRTPQ